MEQELKNAIESVSNLILLKKKRLKGEESHPNYATDQSDDLMKRLREEIKLLQNIRLQLEDLA